MRNIGLFRPRCIGIQVAQIQAEYKATATATALYPSNTGPILLFQVGSDDKIDWMVLGKANLNVHVVVLALLDDPPLYSCRIANESVYILLAGRMNVFIGELVTYLGRQQQYSLHYGMEPEGLPLGHCGTRHVAP